MEEINAKETEEKNILIIEDEFAALRYLIKIVEDCIPLEYHVFGYTNLREAFECMKHRKLSVYCRYYAESE